MSGEVSVKEKNEVMKRFNIFFLIITIVYVISDVGNIAYVGAFGKSEVGEIVSIDKRTLEGKNGEYNIFAPVIQVDENGYVFNVVANIHQSNSNFYEPIGTKVRVKYMINNRAKLIINEADYIVPMVLGPLLFLSFSICIQMLNILGFDGETKKKLNFNIEKRERVKFILLGIPICIVSILSIYYQIMIIKDNILSLNIVPSLLNLGFLIFYIVSIVRVNKVRKEFENKG